MINEIDDDVTPRIAILGAGPIGLEAALYGRFLGYEVTVFERGGVCQHLRKWGHVRLFTPFGMNRSPLGLAAISAQGGDWRPPDDDALLTGRELVDRYYLPLAESDLLADQLRLHTEALSITRDGVLKGEKAGQAARGDAEFRILTRDSRGAESVHTADVVIDATGTYGHPNWMGVGGGPAIGELGLRLRDRRAARFGQEARFESGAQDGSGERDGGVGERDGHVEYGLPDILGAERERYAGRRVLLVGAGYSAATSALALHELARHAPGTRTTWVTRSGGAEPIRRFENDRLIERNALAEAANRIAEDKDSAVQHVSGTWVARIERAASTGETDTRRTEFCDALFRVELRGAGARTLEIDRIIANVGYRPDVSLFEELQVPICYATEGPLELAAALAGDDAADCLDQAAHGAETLSCGEPNFYILGAKSRGRASNFLLSVGLQQIREVFTLIGESADLDLYNSIQTLKV